MSQKNRQVLLANRPHGWVQERDFQIVENDLPALREGEVLVKNLYLSLDPYMRGRMNAGKSYAAPAEPGQVMPGVLRVHAASSYAILAVFSYSSFPCEGSPAVWRTLTGK